MIGAEVGPSRSESTFAGDRHIGAGYFRVAACRI